MRGSGAEICKDLSFPAEEISHRKKRSESTRKEWIILPRGVSQAECDWCHLRVPLAGSAPTQNWCLIMFQLSLYNLAVGGYTTSQETQQRRNHSRFPAKDTSSLSCVCLCLPDSIRKAEFFIYQLPLKVYGFHIPFQPEHTFQHIPVLHLPTSHHTEYRSWRNELLLWRKMLSLKENQHSAELRLSQSAEWDSPLPLSLPTFAMDLKRKIVLRLQRFLPQDKISWRIFNSVCLVWIGTFCLPKSRNQRAHPTNLFHPSCCDWHCGVEQTYVCA